MAVAEPTLNQVTIDHRALAAALRQLVSNPQMVAYGQAGVNRTPRLIEFIVCELHPDHKLPSFLPFSAVCVTLGDGGGPLRRQRLQLIRWWDEAVSPVGPIALLSIEQRPRRGQVTGVLLTSANAPQPVHVLKLVGPGMQRVWTREGQETFPTAPLTARDRERWSRLIGAVGEESWQTLRALRFCLVGVGRTGSVVAASLARMGVWRLTLIDPNRLELHNLDAMEGVTEKDLGRFKVAGVQEAVTALSDGAPIITALPDSILTLRAFVSAKEADVLICCADNDGARLATPVRATISSDRMVSRRCPNLSGERKERRDEHHAERDQGEGGVVRVGQAVGQCVAGV